MLGVKALLLDEFPPALDQVEMGRIGRQKEQFDVKMGRQGLNESAALIAGVIENQGDGCLEIARAEFSQQLAHAFGIDIRIIRHGDHFQVERIDSAQHVEALATARRLDPGAGETPQTT